MPLSTTRPDDRTGCSDIPAEHQSWRVPLFRIARQEYRCGTASNRPIILYYCGTTPRAPRKEAMPSAPFDFPPDPAGNSVDFRYLLDKIAPAVLIVHGVGTLKHISPILQLDQPGVPRSVDEICDVQTDKHLVIPVPSLSPRVFCRWLS